MNALRAFLLTVLLLPALLLGAVEQQAGPYKISLSTQPRVIPVGQAKVAFRITDATGKPLEGLEVRSTARMPGMNMGEREQVANPQPGEPGTYSMTAAFPMAGPYEVEVKIAGVPGNATTAISVKTGQDTGSASGGFSLISLLPWVVGIALVAYVVARMRKAGQGASWHGIVNKGTVGGVLLLAALLAVSIFAVNNLRRQGAMTPLEAQVMEMNTPAPPGTTAVLLSTVERGNIAETVSYSGQAVGFVEQDVIPRVTGVITWMPFYVGDRIKKGQVLARLDTSQLDPQLAERAAMTNMAAESVGVAATEYTAALQEVAEARAQLGAKEGMVEEANSMLDAARQERIAMDADLAVMRADVADANAEIAANKTMSDFAADELKRNQQLYAKGAISRSELQMSESKAADAEAKLHHAHSMLTQANAKVRAATANVKKADAMVAAAQKKVKQAQADVRAARAAIRSREAAAASAKQMISKERAGVAQAKAGYDSAAAQRGYSAIKAELDGVVTQRLISPGVLVNPGQSILKVAQISPIRLQANVAERDLSRISVGTPVTILNRSGESSPIQTTIRSISPAVDPQARTGVVEVVLTNSDGRFLPGQYVEMQIQVGGSEAGLTVPVEAVQRPASEPGLSKPFVWVASAGSTPGSFSVRRTEVQLGSSDGKRISVLSGLTEGQKVVTRGGSYLRDGGEVTAATEKVAARGPVVEIFATGYKPDVVNVERGKEVTITFIRRSEEGCGTEIVFPDLKIEKPLPLNKPVEVTLKPEKAGELKFTCGMDMLAGKVVVR